MRNCNRTRRIWFAILEIFCEPQKKEGPLIATLSAAEQINQKCAFPAPPSKDDVPLFQVTSSCQLSRLLAQVSPTRAGVSAELSRVRSGWNRRDFQLNFSKQFNKLAPLRSWPLAESLFQLQ